MLLYLHLVMAHPPPTSVEALPHHAIFLWEVACHGSAFHAGEFVCRDLVIGSLAGVIVMLLWS